jgi:hypothetical protein
LLTAALDVSGETFRGWRPAVFPLLHVGRDTAEADTHVDSCGDIFSDPGANPGASTIRLASEASEANGVLSERVITRESKDQRTLALWRLD